MDRLHRSRRNRIIFGVCGGLSEYLRIDATLIRIVAVLVAFMGPGLLFYIAAAIIMPEEKSSAPNGESWGTGQDGSRYECNYKPDGSGSGRDDIFSEEFDAASGGWDQPPGYHPEKTRLVVGTILVGLGVIFLFRQFMPSLFDLKIMIPLLMVIAGGIIVFRRRN